MLNLISVYQLFSVVPALICEITVLTVITVKTFEKTRLSYITERYICLQNSLKFLKYKDIIITVEV